VKLDNNQTLNHAITAHKEGKLDEAERLSSQERHRIQSSEAKAVPIEGDRSERKR
jgi:hypothetical protein